MHLGPLDVVLLGGLAIAAFTDARSGRIPNALTFPMMALGIAMNAALPDHWRGLIGCAAGFALHYPLFLAGIQRGGDSKLMMGVGAVLGWSGVLEATVWMALLYLPVGLAVLAARGELGNLVAVGKYLAAKARKDPDAGPPPEQNWFVTGPVIAVAGALAWGTDWLSVLGWDNAPGGGLRFIGLCVFLLGQMGGCAYVTKDDYLKYWDVDGDGWPVGNDCEPDDELIFPYAPDRRGDGCDSDCGTEPDADGDDWPDKADCGPDDATRYPCAPDSEGDSVDSDCDGFDGARTDTCPGDDPDYEDPTYGSCEEAP